VAGFLHHYLAAVQMHTRMPIQGSWALPEGQPLPPFSVTAAHFPGVGWLTGFVACAVFTILSLLLPDKGFSALAAAIGCIGISALMTGGAHEAALADLADLVQEIGARLEPGRIPPIRGEPRVGAAGVVTLVLVLAFKMALLTVLASHSPGAVIAALLAAHVVSRFWPVVLLLRHPEGAALRPGPRAVLVAFAWCVPPLLAVFVAQGAPFVLCAVLVSALPMLGLHWALARRLRSFAVDASGSAQQLCELGFYLGAAIALGLR
jgi:adenosylcobinamide-GDP ribazoletransferase